MYVITKKLMYLTEQKNMIVLKLNIILNCFNLICINSFGVYLWFRKLINGLWKFNSGKIHSDECKKRTEIKLF